MPERQLLKGPAGHRIIQWAPTEEILARGFPTCEKVTRKDYTKVIAFGKEYVTTGRFPDNKQKFKVIEDEEALCEIKGHQVRLLGFFDGKTFVIVHCVYKQRDDIPKPHLKKANKLREQYYGRNHH